MLLMLPLGASGLQSQMYGPSRQCDDFPQESDFFEVPLKMDPALERRGEIMEKNL